MTAPAQRAVDALKALTAQNTKLVAAVKKADKAYEAKKANSKTNATLTLAQNNHHSAASLAISKTDAFAEGLGQ